MNCCEFERCQISSPLIQIGISIELALHASLNGKCGRLAVRHRSEMPGIGTGERQT